MCCLIISKWFPAPLCERTCSKLEVEASHALKLNINSKHFDRILATMKTQNFINCRFVYIYHYNKCMRDTVLSRNDSLSLLLYYV